MAYATDFYPPRAAFAAKAEESRGRLRDEQASPTRSEFHRDRDRIIHATSFRRLKHKTQVFVAPYGDHFRTRLTHTVEVAQIARSLARALGLDEDLAETLALAHDLGHTPFGHTGEDALDEAMAPYGGFDHNAQSFKLLTQLERRYADFDGLNLTWETLEGLVKHNGPLIGPDGRPTERYAKKGIPGVITQFDAEWPLELSGHASLEAQAAAIADDIAYDSHDIDDGLRAGLITLDSIRAVPFLSSILAEVDGLHPGIEHQRRAYEVTRRVITRMVENVINEATKRIREAAPQSAADVRKAGRTLIEFSPAMAQNDRDLKAFMFTSVYRHPDVKAVRMRAAEIVKELFDKLFHDPSLLPGEWREGLDVADDMRRSRRVADYIAGMTDNFALSEYERLFDRPANLR